MAVIWGGAGLCSVEFSAAAALEPDQLFEKISPSVWSVVTFDRESKPVKQGSAVVIGREIAVTNCHVVEGSEAVLLRRENMAVEAEVQHVDTPRDLCQLRVPNLPAPSVDIAPVESLRVGARVYAIGNARGLENTMSEGLVSGIRKTKGRLEAIQTTAPISPGSSGGGLFDGQGRLIGITTFSVKDGQNLNFAMPAAWISELPARHAEAARPSSTSAPAPVAAAPTPVPRVPVRVPRPPPETATEFHPGDTLEYRLTEQLTGTSHSVLYRLDRVESDRLVFNYGQRIESLNGGLLSQNEAHGGEIDFLTTERGWDRSSFPAGSNWREEYVNERGGITAEYRLKVEHLGSTRVRVAAGEFDAVVYALEGYLTRNAFASGRYSARLWYSTALRRPVLFEVSSRSTGNRGASTFHIQERFELVRIAGGER